MSPSAIISQAWQLYKRHWRHFVVIALVFYLALAAVSVALTLALGVFGAVLGVLVSLVGVFWLQGTLTEAVADVRDGRADLSIGDTFGRVRPRLGTLLGAGLLAGLGIAAGLVLLIVPGLVLLTWWIAIVPAVVLEGRGVMASFSRSRELVRGQGWNVFGVIVLSMLIFLGASFVVGLLAGLAFVWAPDELRSFVANVVSGSLTAPMGALAWTLTYFQLRELNDAPAELEPSPA